MSAYRASGSFKPFEGLKALVRVAADKNRQKKTGTGNKHSGSAGADSRRCGRSPGPGFAYSGDTSEDDLFASAMADVTPIQQSDRELEPGGTAPDCDPPPERECDAIHRLRRLVDAGEGFIVAQTPEYMEGTACGVHPEVARRLHSGVYSIQAHIDLHGFSIKGAQEVFDAFLSESIKAGRRAILIVHGRGLSSPTKPVLKPMVYEWLTCGTWRKWVIAFTSARLVDGGAGATYVLLRQKPQTKSSKKRFRQRKKQVLK
jgi:DNA-nicking Smr family endonuclease